MARSINIQGIQMEHWQVMYKGAKEVSDFGSLGPSGEDLGSIAAGHLGLKEAKFGPEKKEMTSSCKYRIVRKLNAVNEEKSKNASNQGYNLILNNCIHISNIQK